MLLYNAGLSKLLPSSTLNFKLDITGVMASLTLFADQTKPKSTTHDVVCILRNQFCGVFITYFQSKHTKLMCMYALLISINESYTEKDKNNE